MSKSRTTDSTTSDAAFEFAKTPFPVFDPGDMAAAGSRNVEYATRAARACFSGAAQMNRDMVDFMNLRVRKDIACAQTFMTAKTSRNAYETQANFLQEAMRDYAEQASKLFALAADIAESAMAPARERAGEVLEEIDEQAEKTARAASEAA